MWFGRNEVVVWWCGGVVCVVCVARVKAGIEPTRGVCETEDKGWCEGKGGLG